MKKDAVVKIMFYVVGVLMLGYIAASSDWMEIWTHLKSAPFGAIMLLMFFQCITMLLINVQWKSLADEVCNDISFSDVVLMNCMGNIMDSLTPGVKMAPNQNLSSDMDFAVLFKDSPSLLNELELESDICQILERDDVLFIPPAVLWEAFYFFP